VAHPGYGDMMTREIVMDEQTTATIYEPPMLVELGKFNEDTFGSGDQQDFDDPGQTSYYY
jgi:hypothetical protein